MIEAQAKLIASWMHTPLIEALLDLMHQGNADYTLAFRLLADALDDQKTQPFTQLFKHQQGLIEWTKRWHKRLKRQSQSVETCMQIMRQTNPTYIPRNHRIEEAIVAIVERGDFSLMERLRHILAHPYQEQDGFAEYTLPPSESERVRQTFCGT